MLEEPTETKPYSPPTPSTNTLTQKTPVRFIDAFIDSLNLEKLGFKHSIPSETGRPSYNPADLLKLYVCTVTSTRSGQAGNSKKNATATSK
jgi:transposase